MRKRSAHNRSMDRSILVRVGVVSELGVGQVLRVEIPDHPPVAVFNIDGRFYATADTCTHAQASLSEGDLEGDEVVCPVHFGAFHVPTGKPLCFPVTEPLPTYPVVVQGSDVYVEV